MQPFLITAVVLAAALAGGCASSPQASFYTLSAEHAQAQAQTETGTPAPVPTWAIVIGAVNVPEINDRPQFVLRVDPNRVTLDEFSRWADPLKSQIRRVIAADLALQFPGALVPGYPQNMDSAVTYYVSTRCPELRVDAGSGGFGFGTVVGEAAEAGRFGERAHRGERADGHVRQRRTRRRSKPGAGSSQP